MGVLIQLDIVFTWLTFPQKLYIHTQYATTETHYVKYKFFTLVGID